MSQGEIRDSYLDSYLDFYLEGMSQGEIRDSYLQDLQGIRGRPGLVDTEMRPDHLDVTKYRTHDDAGGLGKGYKEESEGVHVHVHAAESEGYDVYEPLTEATIRARFVEVIDTNPPSTTH